MRGYPSNLNDLATHIEQPSLPLLVKQFLLSQINQEWISESEMPTKVKAVGCVAVVHSPNYDPSQVFRDLIRVTPKWRGRTQRCDCVFIGAEGEGTLNGMHVAQALLLFSFTFHQATYTCCLVHWFEPVGDEPDSGTGMWVVEREYGPTGEPSLAVVHTDCIVRAAHLIGFYGSDHIERDDKVLNSETSLSYFKKFYVNRFVDLHAHELLSKP